MHVSMRQNVTLQLASLVGDRVRQRRRERRVQHSVPALHPGSIQRLKSGRVERTDSLSNRSSGPFGGWRRGEATERASWSDPCASIDDCGTVFPPGGFGQTMLRRPVILLGLFVLAIALGITFDGARRQRIHADNMARAELFKREFDAHMTIGASLAAVEEYLRAKPVTVTRSMGYRDGRDFVNELMIEMANERSVHWYCGRVSVGLKAEFSEVGTLSEDR